MHYSYPIGTLIQVSVLATVREVGQIFERKAYLGHHDLHGSEAFEHFGSKGLIAMKIKDRVLGYESEFLGKFVMLISEKDIPLSVLDSVEKNEEIDHPL